MGLQIFTEMKMYGDVVLCKNCQKEHIVVLKDNSGFWECECGQQNKIVVDSLPYIDAWGIIQNAREMRIGLVPWW